MVSLEQAGKQVFTKNNLIAVSGVAIGVLVVMAIGSVLANVPSFIPTTAQSTGGA